MSRLTEQELTEILDENKGISMVNPNRVYPPLPPAENIMPLMRIPEQATLCEKIGGTEYTVTAHFREDGRDLLGLLSRIFMRDTADYSFDWRGILYLHFILSCLLSERRKHCKDSRKKSPPCTVV